jgi:hypothetical protein
VKGSINGPTAAISEAETEEALKSPEGAEAIMGIFSLASERVNAASWA